MSYTSPAILVFVIPVLAVYWHLRDRRRLAFLLAANYLFYAWCDLRLVWVLLASTGLTWWCGQQIHRAPAPAQKRRWLAVSLVGSLGFLAWFKYAGFFTRNVAGVAATLGWHHAPLVTGVVLPLGISYYTFQLLSYTLDLNRGVIRPARSFLGFAAYSSFFANIVSGPIARAREMLPQFEKERGLKVEEIEYGLRRILMGLFMKLFVADTLAQGLVDPVFAAPGHFSRSALGLAAAGYTLQLYADFSGYSSIAIGVARLFGLVLPENFRWPFLSRNIAEFWRRWHITLSRWLRDYLWWALAKKVPMTGGLRDRLRGLAALLTVFLVCGLWHGASWTFVAWGGLHGAYIVIYDSWRRWRGTGASERKEEDAPTTREESARVWRIPPPAGAVAAWLVTQCAVVASMVLLRSRDFTAFAEYGRSLFAGGGTGWPVFPPLAGLALLACLADHLGGLLWERRPQVQAWIPAPVQAGFYVAVILFLFWARPEHPGQFIYYRY